MSQGRETQQEDELFFDQLKDQFALFYALTVTAMDIYKTARKDYQARASQAPATQAPASHKDGPQSET